MAEVSRTSAQPLLPIDDQLSDPLDAFETCVLLVNTDYFVNGRHGRRNERQ